MGVLVGQRPTVLTSESCVRLRTASFAATVRVPDELMAEGDGAQTCLEWMYAGMAADVRVPPPDGADEPTLVTPPEPLAGVCDRCGEPKDDTDWFESWKGRLEVCGECRSDAAMEE